MADTLRGFKEICDGLHDEVTEQCFYMVGTIDEALERAEARDTSEISEAAESGSDIAHQATVVSATG